MYGCFFACSVEEILRSFDQDQIINGLIIQNSGYRLLSLTRYVVCISILVLLMISIIVPGGPKRRSSMYHRKIQLTLRIPLQLLLNPILLRVDEARDPGEESATEVQKHKGGPFDQLHVNHVTDFTFSDIATI